jgi:hypothetical protein
MKTTHAHWIEPQPRQIEEKDSATASLSQKKNPLGLYSFC